MEKSTSNVLFNIFLTAIDEFFDGKNMETHKQEDCEALWEIVDMKFYPYSTRW